MPRSCRDRGTVRFALAQYSHCPLGPGPAASNSSASSVSMQCGGSHAMASGVKTQPRRRASATLVPPHEQLRDWGSRRKAERRRAVPLMSDQSVKTVKMVRISHLRGLLEGLVSWMSRWLSRIGRDKSWAELWSSSSELARCTREVYDDFSKSGLCFSREPLTAEMALDTHCGLS